MIEIKPTNPNVAYSTAWNIRRSMNILRSFGLGHSKFLPHEDDDGDVEIEIDEVVLIGFVLKWIWNHLQLPRES